MKATVLVLAVTLVTFPALQSSEANFSNANAKVALHLKTLPTGKAPGVCERLGSLPCNFGESNLLVNGSLNTGYDLYLVVADGDSSAGIGGASFGIEYESGLFVGSWTRCADLEFPGGPSNINWPQTGSGNLLTWDSAAHCQRAVTSGDFSGGVTAVLGCFYVYAYAPASFSITERLYEDPPELAVAACNGSKTNLPTAIAAGRVSFGDTTGFDPCKGFPPDDFGDELSGVLSGADYVPNRLTVSLPPGVLHHKGGRKDGPLEEFTVVDSTLSSRLIALNPSHIRLLSSDSHDEIFRLALADSAVMLARSSLDQCPILRFSEPDYYYEAAFEPTDPKFPQQWWLQKENSSVPGVTSALDISATEAWNFTTGTINPVLIGVIDTGIDDMHPDLPHVILGPNFVTGGASTDDEVVMSHGTAVAGLIGGRGANSVFGTGVNWGTELLSIKALDQYGKATSGRLAAAIDYAKSNGIKLVSLAAAGDYHSYQLALSVKLAKQSGMLIITAMGDDNSSAVRYPAGYSPEHSAQGSNTMVLAVGAIDKTGRRWDDQRLNTLNQCSYFPILGSNFNDMIDIAAPGGRQIATLRTMATGGFNDAQGDCDGGFGGTSAAAGIVMGVASLVKSYKPILLAEDIEKVLIHTADDIPKSSTYEGWDDWTGYGCVNADRALEVVRGQLVQRGIAYGGTETYRWQNVNLTTFNVPGLSNGIHIADRVEITHVVSFPTGFEDATPMSWGRAEGSVGWDYFLSHDYYTDTDGFCEVDHVTRTQIWLRTYVYYVQPCIGCQREWYPASPSGVKMAWTAIGRALGSGVEAGQNPGVLVRALNNPSPNAFEFSIIGTEENAPVDIRIYDLSGRAVWKTSGTATGGEFATKWECGVSHVGPGVYFYEVKAGAMRKHGKLILVR